MNSCHLMLSKYSNVFLKVFSYLTPTMPTSSFGITMDLGEQCLDEVMSKSWQNKLAYYKLTFKKLLPWIWLVTFNMRPCIWQHSSTYWHPQAHCHMKLDLKSIHFLTQYYFTLKVNHWHVWSYDKLVSYIYRKLLHKKCIHPKD
jgi:hypothetical protein